MEVILILIVVSLILAGGFLGVFLWASKSGQFEDTTTPALRILTDDPAAPAPGGGPVRAISPTPSNPQTS
jgi:cbb3-type cytochrome oxidase maturation protein